jgi:DNA-binding beta-propeller fold protein YncE
MNMRSLLLGGLLLLAPQAPRFTAEPMWPRPMPKHWILGSVTGVAVDARDHVFVVNLTDTFNQRTETGLELNPPSAECCLPAPNVIEYDAAGNVVGHFGGKGEGYDWPEMNAGVAVDPKGNVWIGGQGGADSRILKFAPDGKFIAQFGEGAGTGAAAGNPRGGDTAYGGVSGRSAPQLRTRGPVRAPGQPANSNSSSAFGGPARFSFDASANEAYVADGYRNHRVAVIDMDNGKIKRYWGAYGKTPDDAAVVKYDPSAQAPTHFGVVRCAALSADGHVYVCDSNNDRIQVFTKEGKFVKEVRVAPQTLGAGSVWDIAFSRDPAQRYLYVADGMNEVVHVLDRGSLTELTSFGDGGRQPGQFYAVDAIAVDSRGNLYTAETYEGKRVQKFTFNGVGPVTTVNAGTVWPQSTRPAGP